MYHYQTLTESVGNGIVVRVVSVTVRGVRVPLRIGLVWDRFDAAGQKAGNAPVALKEGVAAGKVIVAWVAEEEPLPGGRGEIFLMDALHAMAVAAKVLTRVAGSAVISWRTRVSGVGRSVPHACRRGAPPAAAP